ncbi:PHP domain-containing protein [Exiguobacterium sp. SH0S1]|uniref:TrlF family AAA-like ATPase n=1 Tax=Exiguobacterium sp. SH0S1 TaxID=2510949 RepID=UPI00103BBC16|nr:PHP domain-containing protein [Exiguobacterium sp. SH0S1]TCI80926.1 PHP domain-containing protein [Exiguobacterium sp. SH0S1]
MNKVRGLNWYKCDLHLHTVTSDCFEDQSVTAEEWVQACLDNGLSCVAVTDHNTGDGINVIKQAASGKLVIFPGVEVTCGDSKQHALVLFDPSKDSKHVNAFLSFIEVYESNISKENYSTSLSIFDVAEKAKIRNGIVIAAHIDQYSGLGPFSDENKHKVCEENNILGVQIVHKEIFQNSLKTEDEMQNYFNDLYPNISKDIWLPWVKTSRFFQDKKIAKLTFSDNPAGINTPKHGLYGIGSRYTWIKMDEKITIDSLKQALFMPELRIINDFDFKESTQFHSSVYIEELQIENTTYNLKNSMDTINFNPQLTTIIGGRGTGKSGVLRLVRNSLNLLHDIQRHDEILKDHNEFCRLKSNDLGVFTSETKTNLKVIVGESQYFLKFENNSEIKHQLKVLHVDGTETEIPVDQISNVIEKLGIKLFSQKQVYDISKKPDALRNFIDSSISPMEKLKNKLQACLEDYRKNLTEIHNMEKRLKEKSVLELKLKDLENEENKISAPEIVELLEDEKQFSLDRDNINNVFKTIDVKIEKINQALSVEVSTLDEERYNVSSHPELFAINEKIKDYLLNYEKIMSDSINDFIQFKENIISDFKATKWNTELLEHSEKLTKKREEQGDVTQLILKKELISKEILDLKKELLQLAELETKVVDLLKQKTNIFEELHSVRKEMRSVRFQFIDDVLKDNNLLSGQVNLFRDFEDYLYKLREHFSRSTGFENDFEKIVSYVQKGKVETQLQKLVDLIKETKATDKNPLELSGRFVNLINDMSQLQLEEMNVLFPEDEIVIKYKSSEKEDYKPLSNASAGQKTSAILTLILSVGEGPLILDQPEDDLDNSLIYSLIVDRIKKSKSKRQIIIVTHNANIPVNGDSDLVLVMNSNKLSFTPKEIGSIDNTKVKDSICKIMEGGTSAFKSRAVKYDLNTLIVD